MTAVNKDSAIFNPAQVFKTPHEIMEDKKIELTKEEKVNALRTWRYDIQLNQMAEEENMHADEQDKIAPETLLDEINKALNQLDSH